MEIICELGDILYLDCPNRVGVLACGVSIALSLSMYHLGYIVVWGWCG